MSINYRFTDQGDVADKAAARVNSIYDTQARLTAGNAVAAGDYTTGSHALARAGLTDEATKLRATGQAQADDAASREGLQSYVAGDYAKARGSFAKGGSLSGVQAADAGAKATREQSLQVALKIANAVETDVKNGADPAGAFDKAAPLFGKLFPDSAKDLPGYRDAFIKDPQGTIAAIKAATAKELEAFTLSQGEARFGADGKEIASVAPKPDYLVVPEGGKAIPLNGSPPLPGESPGAPPAPGGNGQPRNLRNNNPGNIEDGQFAKSLPGYKGSDGRFAIFDTPQNGQAAQGQLLASYGKRGFDTIGKVVGRWAPASDGNDVAAYTKFVSDRLGVSPDEQLDLSNPQVQQKLAGAMAAFEGGGKSASNGPAVAAVGAQPGDPAGTVYGSPKPGKEMERPATAAEKAVYGVAADVPAKINKDGGLEVITGTGAALKPVPAQIQQGRIGNSTSIKQIDDAIAAIKANPGALGLKNYAGEGINQRIDPNGIDTRAKLANIGSLIIHDRSGAAVTASETPRLLPFVPSATDTADAAVKKLLALKHQYESANSEIELAYGPDSGYRPMGGMGGGSSPAVAPKAAPKPLASASAPKIRVYNPKTGKLE